MEPMISVHVSLSDGRAYMHMNLVGLIHYTVPLTIVMRISTCLKIYLVSDNFLFPWDLQVIWLRNPGLDSVQTSRMHPTCDSSVWIGRKVEGICSSMFQCLSLIL